MAAHRGRKVILSSDSTRTSASNKLSGSVFDRLGAQLHEGPKSGPHSRYPSDSTVATESEQRIHSVQGPRRTLKISKRLGERREQVKSDQTSAKDFETSTDELGVSKSHIKTESSEKKSGREKLVKKRSRKREQSHKDPDNTRSSSGAQSLKNVSDISDDEGPDLRVKSAIVLKSPGSRASDYPDLSPVSDNGEDKRDSKSIPSGYVKQRDSTELESKKRKKTDESKISSDKESKDKVSSERGEDSSRKRKLKLTRSSHSSVHASKTESGESPPKKKLKVSEMTESKREYEKEMKLSSIIAMVARDSGGSEKPKYKEKPVDDEQKVMKESERSMEKDFPRKSRSKEKEIPEKERSRERESKERDRTYAVDRDEKFARGERDWAKGVRDKGTKVDRDKVSKGGKAKKERDKTEKGDSDRADKSERERAEKGGREEKEERSKVGKGDRDKEGKGDRDKEGKVDRFESVVTVKEDKRDKDKGQRSKTEKEKTERGGKEEKAKGEKVKSDRDKGDKEGRDKDRGDKEIREKDRGDKELKDRDRVDKEGRDKDRGDKEKGEREGREKDREDKDRGDKEGRVKDRGDKEGRVKDRGEKERRDKDRGEKEGRDKGKGDKDRGDKDRRDKERRDKDRGDKDRGDKDRGDKEEREKDRGIEGKEKDRGDKDKRDKTRGDKDRGERDRVDKQKDWPLEQRGKEKQRDRDSSSRERGRTPVKEKNKDLSGQDQDKKESKRSAESDVEWKATCLSPDLSHSKRSKRTRPSTSPNTRGSKRRRQASPTPVQSPIEGQDEIPEPKRAKLDKPGVVRKADPTAALDQKGMSVQVITEPHQREKQVAAGITTVETASKENVQAPSQEHLEMEVVDEVLDGSMPQTSDHKTGSVSSLTSELSESMDKTSAGMSHGKKTQDKAKEKDKKEREKERSKDRGKEKERSRTERDLSDKMREYKKGSGGRYEKTEDPRYKEREGRREGHQKGRAVSDRERSSHRSRRERSKEWLSHLSHRGRERDRREGDTDRDRKDSGKSSETSTQRDGRDGKLGDSSAVQSDEELETLSDTGSDAFLDEETKAKEKQCELLESMSAAQQLLVDVNWAGLESKNRELVAGDFTQRMSPAAVLSRVGVSASLAGEELYQRVQKICSGQGDDLKLGSLISSEQKQKSVLVESGLSCRLLTARRDMALRARLRQLPNQGPHTSQPPPVDTELYQMALSIYRQQENNGVDDPTKSRCKLVQSKVGCVRVNV